MILLLSLQGYWLHKAYWDEHRSLARELGVLFRETAIRRQMAQIALGQFVMSTPAGDTIRILRTDTSKRERSSRFMVNLSSPLEGRPIQRNPTIIEIEADRRHSYINRKHQIRVVAPYSGKPNELAYLDSVYRVALQENGLSLAFRLDSLPAHKADSMHQRNPGAGFFFQRRMGNWQPALAEAVFEQPFWMIIRQMKWPLILSFCMIAATLAAFIFLNRSLRSQQRLAALKNDFVSNITHELKTPVATVAVAIESLKNFSALNSREKTEQYLDISANELKRLNLLIDKVLRQGMFDNGKAELSLEAMDLNALVEEVLQSMQLQLEKASALVKWQPAAEPLPLLADKLQLMSVVFNLVDNAVKYSASKPEITLTTVRNEGEVVLTVSDKGIGIPQAYVGRVFEKFFRVPTGNTHNAKGYGLGLSYVAEVVAQHKGSIRCFSEEGKGSHFEVRLPLMMANTA